MRKFSKQLKNTRVEMPKEGQASDL